MASLARCHGGSFPRFGGNPRSRRRCVGSRICTHATLGCWCSRHRPDPSRSCSSPIGDRPGYGAARGSACARNRRRALAPPCVRSGGSKAASRTSSTRRRVARSSSAWRELCSVPPAVRATRSEHRAVSWSRSSSLPSATVHRSQQDSNAQPTRCGERSDAIWSAGLVGSQSRCWCRWCAAYCRHSWC